MSEMKQHGSSIVDTLLVATEKCVNAGKCDIVHQTNRERESSTTPQYFFCKNGAASIQPTVLIQMYSL